MDMNRPALRKRLIPGLLAFRLCRWRLSVRPTLSRQRCRQSCLFGCVALECYGFSATTRTP